MLETKLRLVFWETTPDCNLKCPHCRVNNSSSPKNLLTTQEAKSFIKQISLFAKPILVFSGGEPLLRKDIYELISFTLSLGLKPALATNATLITKSLAQKLKASGLKVVAVSVYGATEEAHDSFCGQIGAFKKTLAGIENIKKAGLSLQINTTITKKNLGELEPLANFSLNQKATSYHLFFLVPTGRGRSLDGDQISPKSYETAFNRVYELEQNLPLRIKVTCAPHYYRILEQRKHDEPDKPKLKQSEFHATTKGCLAGQGVCFVSSSGEVYGCGYMPISAGNLESKSFKDIWFESDFFQSLRDESRLEGKCGFCEFKTVCGGCRARAYQASGNYLEEEPECSYQPSTVKL